MSKGVSIIMCCYNSEKRLPVVLDHVFVQKFTKNINWEIIVVDNASKDNTQKVAIEKWRGEKNKLRVIYEPEAGLINARKTGIANAKYEYISFIDDDNWVCDSWVEIAYEIMEKYPEVGICGGLGEPVFEKSEPEWFSVFQEAYAVGPQAKDEGLIDMERGYLHGAGIILRKEVWNKLLSRGFKFLLTGRKGKSLSSGEDFELSLAIRSIGYDLYYSPRLRFKHFMPENRLNIRYLKKLYGAFGKAFAILNLYIAELSYQNSIKRLLFTNYFISTIYGFYLLVKSIPPAIVKKSNKDPASKLNIIYAWNYFTERLFMIKNFRQAYKSVKINTNIKN